MIVRWLAGRGNVQLAQVEGRRFPGLLVQGDTLSTLIADLEEEAPESFAHVKAQGWLRAYEEMMTEQGLDLPYSR